MEYYDRFCENYYDINDYDGNCGNRYEFLKDFEKSKNMSLNFWLLKIFTFLFYKQNSCLFYNNHDMEE